MWERENSKGCADKATMCDECFPWLSIIRSTSGWRMWESGWQMPMKRLWLKYDHERYCVCGGETCDVKGSCNFDIPKNLQVQNIILFSYTTGIPKGTVFAEYARPSAWPPKDHSFNVASGNILSPCSLAMRQVTLTFRISADSTHPTLQPIRHTACTLHMLRT